MGLQLFVRNPCTVRVVLSNQCNFKTLPLRFCGVCRKTSDRINKANNKNQRHFHGFGFKIVTINVHCYVIIYTSIYKCIKLYYPLKEYTLELVGPKVKADIGYPTSRFSLVYYVHTFLRVIQYIPQCTRYEYGKTIDDSFEI